VLQALLVLREVLELQALKALLALRVLQVQRGLMQLLVVLTLKFNITVLVLWLVQRI
jgi:hypothetical protein